LFIGNFPCIKDSVYIDDGYTGTNFNRPGFQQMLSDIDMGYVTAVMVKDLSRLGRDYVSVGNYTDSYFPEHGIRFIAVNDAIDSEEGESEIALFKKILNEMYVEIPDAPRKSHYKADTRQGVAVEYLTEPKTA
jgi:site-specific DNA recombinase